MKILPKHMQQMERALPKVSQSKQPEEAIFKAEGETKATVAMFRGCLMDTMFRETNQSTIKLLNKAGCDVVVPDTQNCCGALHGHSGEKQGALELAKQILRLLNRWTVIILSPMLEDAVLFYMIMITC